MRRPHVLDDEVEEQLGTGRVEIPGDVGSPPLYPPLPPPPRYPPPLGLSLPSSSSTVQTSICGTVATLEQLVPVAILLRFRANPDGSCVWHGQPLQSPCAFHVMTLALPKRFTVYSLQLTAQADAWTIAAHSCDRPGQRPLLFMDLMLPDSTHTRKLDRVQKFHHDRVLHGGPFEDASGIGMKGIFSHACRQGLSR